MDLWGWVEDERQKSSDIFYRLLEQGRQTWTPQHIFNRCCVKWLVDGPQRAGDFYDDFVDEYNPRNGCPGQRKCRRDHPCVTLSYDADAKSTIAALSHQLDPFVRYFDGLVSEGKAIKLSDYVYRIDGYLRPNLTAICSHNGFGNHLVSVKKGSREASDAAQSEEIEAKERANKRPRIEVSASLSKESGNDSKPSAAAKMCNTMASHDSEFDDDEEWTEEDFARIDETVAKYQSASQIAGMLDEVMGIVLNERLQFDLQNDFVSLYSMRSVCKTFKKFATSIASEKIKTLDLSITPLVNGKQQYGESKIDGYDSETFHVGCWDPYGGPSDVVSYGKKEKVVLQFQEMGEAGAGYYPIETSNPTFSWDSGGLKLDAECYGDDESGENASYADFAYCGQLMRVYWHPSHADPVKAKERCDFYGSDKLPLGIRIASFYLHQNPRNAGNVSKSQGGVSLDYQVIECDTSEREEIEEEEEVSDIETDDEEEDGYRRVVKTHQIKSKWIHYTGKIRVAKVKVDFGILVKEHACKVWRQITSQHEHTLKERPLTCAEKEYEKFVLAAAGGKMNIVSKSLF